ncbi:MAG: hypothetical protein ACSHYF_10465 [Verrucomicrobiaceae bacterium]
MKTSAGRVFSFLLVLIVGGIVFLFLMAVIGQWLFETVWVLASGWATYPIKVLPQVSYNVEMILCGGAALALALYFSHQFLKWIAEHVEALPAPWSFRYTTYLSFLLLSMFGTSIAMTGIVHQTAWLATNEIMVSSRELRQTTQQQRAANMFMVRLYLLVEDSDQQLPSSLSDAVANDASGLEYPDVFCRYGRDESIPWLYPGGGRMIDEEIFPVIVSPRPNRQNDIVVGYSDSRVEVYRYDELPSEIAVFFE